MVAIIEGIYRNIALLQLKICLKENFKSMALLVLCCTQEYCVYITANSFNEEGILAGYGQETTISACCLYRHFPKPVT